AVEPASGSITNVVDIGKKHGRRRYREAIIEPGDECYALGTTNNNRIITPDAGKLWLGKGTEDSILQSKRKRFRRAGALGGGLLLIGIVAGLIVLV
ncbi:MAG: hypothetical protein ABEI86_01125, partial [Halobacteriaceae archaeon]